MPPMLDDDAPDRKYWTAYDHFMLEREARAKRRAYAYRLLGRFLRAARAAATRFAFGVRVDPAIDRTTSPYFDCVRERAARRLAASGQVRHGPYASYLNDS
jgi:hypothetical protein